MTLDVYPFWAMFSVLATRRTWGFSAPNPISLVEIEAALRLYRVPPERWVDYVEILTSLDARWMEKQLKKRGDETEVTKAIGAKAAQGKAKKAI